MFCISDIDADDEYEVGEDEFTQEGLMEMTRIEMEALESALMNFLTLILTKIKY